MILQHNKRGNKAALAFLTALCLLLITFAAPLAAADTYLSVSKPVSVSHNLPINTEYVLIKPVSVGFSGFPTDGTLFSKSASVCFRGADAYSTVFSNYTSVSFFSFLGLWHMDGNWADDSGNGNNGTAYGSAGFDAGGKSGSAGSFNGINSYIDAGASITLRPAVAVSVEAWIKINPGASGSMYIAGNSDEAAANGYGLVISDAGLVQFKIGDGSWRLVTGNTPIAQGLWYHVAGTYNGDKLKVYVNGVLDAETAATGIITYTNPFRIGYRPGASGAGYFSGLADELAVYNRPLADDEILNHFITGEINVTLPQAPTVNEILTPTASPVITLSGTKDAGTAIYIGYVKIVDHNNLTEWQGTYTLNTGVNVLNISAADSQGYRSQAVTKMVTLDNTAPVISGSIPANNSSTATVIQSVILNLTDAYSNINLAATINGAFVKNSSGQDISGTWTTQGSNSLLFTPQAPFTDGTYTVTVYPTDTLGNTGTALITFSYDITAPAQLFINPVVSPTKLTSQTITGTKSADTATIFAESATATIGAAAYPSAATWSLAVSNLKPGANMITAYAKDAAGNMSAGVSVTILLDNTPPPAPAVNSFASPTKNTSIALSGTKEAGTYLYVNGTKTSNAFAESEWSHTANLNEGSNTFSILAEDEAGNRSVAATASVVRDTTPPVIASSSPVNNSFINQASAIDITLTDVRSSVDFAASLVDAVVKNLSGALISGTWAVDNDHVIFTPVSAFTDGKYTVTLYPVDSLGNKGTVSLIFTVDTTPATVQSLATSPVSPFKAGNVLFTIIFSEPMNTAVQPSVTFGREAPFDTNSLPSGTWVNTTTWRATYPFTGSTGDGNYTAMIASAKDISGNSVAPATIGAFILDTAPPPAPAVDPVATPTKVPNQPLSGTKPADTAIIINGVQKVARNSATTWTFTYPLAEGQNNLLVVARDQAGNDSLPATVPVLLDTVPPVFTVTYRNPSPSVTQTITGTKEPGCVVKLNGQVIFDASDMNPAWSYEITLTAGLPGHFLFVAADALDNRTVKTADITYDISAPAPLGIGVLTADGSGRGTEVTLSWPAYAEVPDVAYYRIYSLNSSFTDITGMTPSGTANKGVKTFKVTGLTSGSIYYFAVVPVDTSDNFNPAVNTVSGIPVDTTAPEDVVITNVTAGYDASNGNWIKVTWKPSINSTGDLADQIIYTDNGSGYDAGVALGNAVAAYTATGLNDATRYKLKITVKDTGGHESAGAVKEGVTRLGNPANITAMPGNARAVISWTAVNSVYVKQYNIYRAVSDTELNDIFAMTFIRSVPSNVFTVTETGLANGETYQYAVTVLNTSGAERSDIKSIGAKPRMDETGPVVNSFSIIKGQVINAPVTITASASDAESAMSKMELFIDGEIPSGPVSITAAGGGLNLSYFWDVIGSTDGNHIVKITAFDQFGNFTEEARNVIVSLAPPQKPVITGHTVTETSPGYKVRISGDSPLSSTVTLKVNDTVVASQQSANGKFAFESVELVEGDNFVAAKASHRGGESPYTSLYKIVKDTGAPANPVNFAAQALSGGGLRFTWSAGAGEVPSGFNLYKSASAFTSKASPGVSKVNTSPVAYMFYDYTPTGDSTGYYAVTATDGSGNESEVSDVAAIASDRSAPVISELNFRYSDLSGAVISPASVAGLGAVKVAFTVSEPLKETPFFALESLSGSPVIISMNKTDETHYEGTFTVTALTPYGTTVYKFSGKDLTGNRGNQQGTGIRIDNKGPAASVQAPAEALKITAEPVATDVLFDELLAAVPQMELKASSGVSAPVNGLTSSDGGLRWTGSVNVSDFPEGQAVFILISAKDGLGNTGTTVSSGANIILYESSPPAPDVPSLLSAKSGKAGVITLNWNPVEGAISYNLYRRAEGESTPAKIKTGMAGSFATDIPPSDGAYYYSLTSIGLLESESPYSAEVSAVSDRTGPQAPSGIILTLGGSGVKAAFSAPIGETPASYNLYRASGPLASIAGLTPAAVSKTTQATDTAPVQSKRFYAVTALDALGNEGGLSESAEIVFPVSPVRNLVIEMIDTASPEITWQPPADGEIVGYYIYRNGNRLTDVPVATLSYTDAYYAGETTYGISAVNVFGDESPVRSAKLQDLSVGFKQGTVLRRGLLETIRLLYASAAQNENINIGKITVKVGAAAESTIEGPFALDAGAALEMDKVVVAATDAAAITGVLVKTSWSPAPGTTVSLIKTLNVSVIAAGPAMEIFSEPLVRDGQASVRIKVNNIGSSRMEFLTGENKLPTKKVCVSLKDQDGNLLASGCLKQFTGAVINIGSYAIARIEPGESFLTDPITFIVPGSVSAKCVIEAVIENTYYNYAKPDQVTAPAMKQSVETTVTDTSYRAIAAVEQPFYAYPQPVLITGRAISNVQYSPANMEVPAPYVPVKIGVSVKGYDRFFTVTTDAKGDFAYTFVPNSNEAGKFSVWAVHPDIGARTVQAVFAIAGLKISPETASIRMAKNRTIDISLKLTNSGETQLGGLLFTTETAPGISAEVVNTGGDTIDAGKTKDIVLRVSSTTSAPDTGYVTLFAAAGDTAAPVKTRFDASITLATAIPVINPKPSYIDTGMVRATQKTSSFVITNKGDETLKNARIEGPATSWMILTTERVIGDIKPGESKSINLVFRPAETTPQNVYNDLLVIYSDNHIPYTCRIQLTVTSDAVGSVMFDLLNELMEHVAQASISIQHQMLPELTYSAKTGAVGTAMLYDMPEGRYSYNISAPGHKPTSGSFVIYPGVTTAVPVALEVSLVQVEWSVTPVIIEDRYEIKITTTFETNVPTPVLVIEPGGITLPELKPTEVYNGEFTVTNYGLVALNEVKIQIPASDNDYDIQVLTAIPETLKAMQKVSVMYRVKRRQLSAALAGASGESSYYALRGLFDEVRGYGGNPCYKSSRIVVSGTVVICPNTQNEKKVTKSAGYSISTPVPGSDCSPSTGSKPAVIIGGQGSQTGGGSSGGGGVITSIANEMCFSPACIKKALFGDCQECTGSSVIMSNGTYEFGETDLTIPAPAIPVDLRRAYRSNAIKETATGAVFAEPADGPLGFGWMTIYFARIEPSVAGKPGDTYVDEDGAYNTFKKDSSGNFLTDMENGLILKKTAAGYELVEIGGRILTFNADGRLISIKDLRGNAVTLGYNTDGKPAWVKDATGRQVLTFAYNAAKRIDSATDIANRTVTYEYDQIGRLVKVKQGPDTIATYTYNTWHGITSKANALNETHTIEYQYPELGIIKRIIDPVGTEMIGQGQQPAGHEKTFRYDFQNRTFYTTDGRGFTKKKIVNEKGALLLEEEISGAEAILTKKVEFLSNRTEKITDAAGNITTIQRDEWRNVIKRVDGEGNETRTVYNSNKKPVTITDALGTVTRFEYDQYSNLIKITQAEGKPEQVVITNIYNNYNQLLSATTAGSTTNTTYNAAGLPATTADPLGNTTIFQYDAWGNKAAVTDPNGNKTEFTHDANGNMLTAKDPLGNTTVYEYNAADRLTKRTDPLLRTTNYETDYRGRVTAAVDPLNNRKEYQYDVNGNLIKITEGVSVTVMTYDSSNRLLTVTDPEGNTTAYEYTGAGCSSCGGGSSSAPAKITDPLGNITRNIYDKAGRVNSVIDPMGKFSLLGRDAEGRVTSRTDANYKITKYQYDGFGRIIKQTDADNGETIFAYDGLGNLKTLTDARGNITIFTYDLAGRKIKETRPMGQADEYTYYPNGLLKTVKDANGQITTYAYDAANRLTEITYADGKKDTFTYDAVGNMLTYSKDYVSASFTWDELNRKTSETVNYGSFGKTYSYTYDGKNNKTTFTTPEGKVYAYAYNRNNQPTSIAFDGKTIDFNYQWNRRTKTILPNGVSTDYDYNANSWLTSIAAGTVLSDQNAYDNVGTLTGKTTEKGSTAYAYDPVYQLTQATGPVLPPESFTYDKIGNRESATEGSQTTAYAHNANNELVSADGLSYVYDANGNMIQKTAGAQVTAYGYNTANRMESVALPDGQIATYTYDPFGRRIKKQIGSDVTYYLYSDEGLIGEYDASGTLKKAYGWLPNMVWGTAPVLMEENGQDYYYHNDHLGTPRKMTDSVGTVVWSADYTAFGEAAIDPASTITSNLRFPGQYYDAETGLHYNYHRYYDPRTGRYLTPDPIGLWGGINQFNYVSGNPLNWIDPWGLVVIFIHGTFSSPNEAFPQDFRSHVMNYYGDDESIDLQWSGGNSDCDRRDAAEKLSMKLRNINKYRPNEPITIVAHSHGGNVALLASQMGGEMDNLVTLGTPIMSKYQPNSSNIGTWNNVYSTNDKVQTLPLGAGRTHSSATNIGLSGYGHSDLHTAGAWDAAFPPTP